MIRPLYLVPLSLALVGCFYLIPLALTFVGCSSCQPIPVPTPEPPPRPTADAAPAPTPPPPAPAPSPAPRDASRPPPVLDACERACNALAAIPCKEGRDPLCVGRCEKVEAEHLTGLHPECLALAKTAAAARLCSSSISCR
jgi:hypothetical protein